MDLTKFAKALMSKEEGPPVIYTGDLEITAYDDGLRAKRVDGQELTEKDIADLWELEEWLAILRGE